jgi:3'(2'), 5'-bisphosphate nucleotidase
MDVLVGSRRSAPELDPYLKGVSVHSVAALPSALKFCRIAEGVADLYIRTGPTMEWDTAAGQAIVEAVGGRVCTLDGVPLKYRKRRFENNVPWFAATAGAADDLVRALRA